MYRYVTLIALAGLVFPLAVSGEEKPEAVADLIQTIELDAPQAEVWEAFTTSELAQQWMAPVVAFDLHSGGTMKTNYDKSAGIGGPGTIVHHIVALQAPHLAVMQTEAPEGSPLKEIIKDVTGTWRFEALTADRTRVTLGMHGWPAGEQSQKVRDFFLEANPGELLKLKKLFPDRPSTKDAMARMRKIVGSWDGESALGNSKLIVRKEIQPGPGGKGLVCTTSFGPEGKRRLHKHEQVWLEPDGSCHFNALDDKGGRVSGTLRCDGDDDVIWDFVTGRQHVRLRMSTGKDEHRFALLARRGSEYVEQFHVDYKRDK